VQLVLECLMRGKLAVTASRVRDAAGPREMRSRLDAVLALASSVSTDSIAVAEKLPLLSRAAEEGLAGVGRVSAALVDIPFLGVLLARMAADVRTGIMRCLARLPVEEGFAGMLTAAEREEAGELGLIGAALAAAAARGLMFAPADVASAAVL